MALKAQQHRAHDPALAEVLTLIQASFASMEGRIDPPSSMQRLTLAELQGHCTMGEVWSLGVPVTACVLFTAKPNRLYIGKLSVAAHARRQGLSRRLIDLAHHRAAALGLPWLELQTRIELVENHATFAALGFSEHARTAHAGFSRPTSITLRCAVDPR
ncbi:Acetyltransferase (GNAT) family protein [Sulfitobacter brevis]|uniref:Acetyltransferase (GNAT) family protein n=1 Tax=Sulfitobacter brevis TaxID=74348 RepID=A0A1I1VL26_9RHOB|nr:GNAT family N-acetyltransferase [Sulfitobacter brevis]SFD83717.1 Acetyltransferase (GNAT) family protein [Sulfitobacter brevis]